MMKKTKKYYKKHKNLKFAHINYMLFILFVSALIMPGMCSLETTGENLFLVNVNGIYVGNVESEEIANNMLWETRRKIASESDEITFLKADMTLTGDEILWGYVDDPADVAAKMEEVMRKSKMEGLHRACTVKIDDYLVNLEDTEAAAQLLQAAVERFDESNEFRVVLSPDENREFSIRTAVISKEAKELGQEENKNTLLAGVDLELATPYVEEVSEEEKSFEDYSLGILDMSFSEKIEIVEAYIPQNKITDLDTAKEEAIKEQETAVEYTVVAGDTLSEIAIQVGIPMDKIVEMNSDLLETENSPLHVGDKLVITIPEPTLSVKRTEQSYFEESYDADVVYIDNDSWYTTEKVVRQQPSAGFRKAIANAYYVNDQLAEKKILKEEIVMEAVPKIVERGTKVPPTYIKPISGGRQSSGFGKRKAPTKGASTFHKGVDWAIPIGTSIYASCGGTVEKAGWGSGYGYVVYINHEDGRQTRYGHCSKVLVTPGQKVKQGDKIALSGNTGVTSGPHVHFEILINGSQVDPLKYLN